MKIMKTVLAVLTLTLFSAICASGVQADDWNKKTVMTFSQPIEIPGQILPAGTYTIKLVDLASERHVVQFLDADGIRVSPPFSRSTTGGLSRPATPWSSLRSDPETTRKP